MQCPKCRGRLHERVDKMGLTRLDCCPDCRGVWFDGKELRAVLREAFEDLRVPVAAAQLTIRCPRCKKRLHAFHYPETTVRVEMCKECGGMWLDTEEFKEISHIRRSLSSQGMLGDEKQPGLVKEALLHFVDSAIDALKSF